MTELNPGPETEPDSEPAAEPAGGPTGTPIGTAEARVDWPALSAGTAGQDPAVAVLLEPLGTLPALPVADHGEVYARLHTDLAEALNEAGDSAS